MPTIIDYPQVLQRMQSQRLRCLYPSSGAFGFARGKIVHVVGWIGPPDPTLRPEALAQTRQVGQPYEVTMAAMAVGVWQDHLSGDAWAMPMSHWVYELDHASSAAWLPDVLQRIGIDPGMLRGRNNGSAIAFALDEADALRLLLQSLLQRLWTSDFMLAFPGHDILCTVHHHKQLWWTTTQQRLLELLPLNAACGSTCNDRTQTKGRNSNTGRSS